MLEEHKKYILENWKKNTSTMLAEQLTTEERFVRPQDVQNFLVKNGISPITKRDLVTKDVIDVCGKGITEVKAIATMLKVSEWLVKEIVDENGLIVHKGKTGPKTKEENSAADLLAKKKIDVMIKKQERSKEIKASRASFTFYNQTGSQILDELREIKTTKRENTLLSNTIKK